MNRIPNIDQHVSVFGGLAIGGAERFSRFGMPIVENLAEFVAVNDVLNGAASSAANMQKKTHLSSPRGTALSWMV